MALLCGVVIVTERSGEWEGPRGGAGWPLECLAALLTRLDSHALKLRIRRERSLNLTLTFCCRRQGYNRCEGSYARGGIQCFMSLVTRFDSHALKLHVRGGTNP